MTVILKYKLPILHKSERNDTATARDPNAYERVEISLQNCYEPSLIIEKSVEVLSSPAELTISRQSGLANLPMITYSLGDVKKSSDTTDNYEVWQSHGNENHWPSTNNEPEHRWRRSTSNQVSPVQSPTSTTHEAPTFDESLAAEKTISRLPVIILENSDYANLHGFTSRQTENDHFAPFKGLNTQRMINRATEADLARSIRELFRPDGETWENLPSDLGSNRETWVNRIMLKTVRRGANPRNNKMKGKKTRRARKWEKRDIGRMRHKINMIIGRKSYYHSFIKNDGRANPWRSMLALFLWTSLVLCIDNSYLAFGKRYLGIDVDLSFASNIHQLLGIGLGFLLYMQAAVSSTRWWNGRIEWQRIMEKNRRLTILLNTHLGCISLAKYGTRMIAAYTICVWSFLQDKCDWTWREELSQFLKVKTVARIMASSRRLRPLSVTYAFQRLIDLCIHYRVLEKEVVRDINPILVSLGESFDSCNRCRIAQLPWIMAVHLDFVVFGFVALLPLTLLGRSSQEPDKVHKLVEVNVTDTSFIGVYLYVLIIGYAFYGLYTMAVDIEDPFSYKKESHSFGLWGLIEYWTALNITDIRHILGFHIDKNEQGRMNANGEYGDYWTVVRLQSAIKKALQNGSIRNIEEVQQKLNERYQDLIYWTKFADSTIKHREESSSEVYLSTEEDDEEELQIHKYRL